tara:strand:+ start:2342 stop:2926 length:585 start_codon:yes stop_codon:yes gene_type:complete
MEVKSLENYVKVYENFLSEDILINFLKICKTSTKFKDADILGDDQKGGHIKKEIRDTLVWKMELIENKSLTEVHWSNLFCYFFKNAIEQYLDDFKSFMTFNITEIQILKYRPGGHYQFHTDSSPGVARTFSCIFFVNDDYEGGDLVFKYPDTQRLYSVKKQKNTMVVWPSNFLYPHSVQPVTKGERYSVVSWAV